MFKLFKMPHRLTISVGVYRYVIYRNGLVSL